MGTPIAVHHNHAWESEGKRYLRLECSGRVLVYFGELDGTLGIMYGPFEHLSAVDSVLYVDGDRFAVFSEVDNLWAIEHTELRCPVLVARAPD